MLKCRLCQTIPSNPTVEEEFGLRKVTCDKCGTFWYETNLSDEILDLEIKGVKIRSIADISKLTKVGVSEHVINAAMLKISDWMTFPNNKVSDDFVLKQIERLKNAL